MRKESHLGVEVASLCHDEILKDIDKRIKAGEKSSIIAVNPEKIMKAQKDKLLSLAMNQATYPIPDGIGVVVASKLKKGTISERVTGIEMMDRLIEHGAKEGYRVFLYGSQEDVVKKAKAVLEGKYPTLVIVGYEDGYSANQMKIIEKINQSGADMLFVALGSPKQEYWIHTYMPQLEVKVLQGVGGSFDVLAGKVRRAPMVFQRAGVEWLYRLIREPRRCKRQLALPLFFLKILFQPRYQPDWTSERKLP